MSTIPVTPLSEDSLPTQETLSLRLDLSIVPRPGQSVNEAKVELLEAIQQNIQSDYGIIADYSEPEDEEDGRPDGYPGPFITTATLSVIEDA